MSSRSVSTQTDDVKSKEDGQKRFKDPSQQAGPSSQNKVKIFFPSLFYCLYQPPALLEKKNRKKNRSDKGTHPPTEIFR